MIKVINVTSDQNIGGAGRCILAFLEEYDRNAFEVLVVLPRGSLLKDKIEEKNVRTIEADGMVNKSLGVKAVWKLIRIFKAEKPDIVHTHASFSARIAARAAGIRPIIYTRHSVFPNRKFVTRGVAKWLSGSLNNFLCDRIIAVAEAAANNIIEAGVDKRKIIIVKNGVKKIQEKTTDEMKMIKNQYRISNSDVVFSMLARLTIVKGHRYFLEAAKRLVVKYDNVKFLIAGTGEDEERLQRFTVEQNLEGNVIFTGFVEDVSDILNITDVSVNASFGTEATSLALLEGMSIAKPIIATDYGGNPELVTDGYNGLLVQKQDSQQLFLAMERLLCDQALRKTLGENARNLYNEKYTDKIMTKNIEKVYITAKEAFAG